ncbi:MAG: exodeoxyribonuclease VII large subunit [Erysipelotrichaceae bacterium]|nr:exodeoxyribonuclease VII large subunit [Erysipelotrichaceae bacterium]
MLSDEYISVSELNIYIKSYLENNYFLNDVYVKGEISNFKLHQSGTLYFAIKDEKSCVNVVMFKSYAMRLKVNLKDGDLVLIRGNISVYEAKGTYSINAKELIYDSKGMLLVQFEQLKAKLLSEGLFSNDHKKPLPLFPKSIGLITAPYGAAIQDMQKTIKSRWPLAQIIIFPCLVQGNDASNDIVKNIKLADEYGVDVIICGRGGGSIEDLWPFNEENVAYAFYNCKTPIISAVGHEIDVTISDYVADVRGLTPTDGAVKATPNLIDVLKQIKNYYDKLNESINNIIKSLKVSVDHYKNSYVLLNPNKIYEKYRFKVDDLENSLMMIMKELTYNEKSYISTLKEDLNKNINLIIQNNHKKLSLNSGALDALSPLKVLKRGYVFATINEKVIKSIDDVNLNDELNLELSNGRIISKVIAKEKL